MKRKLSLLYAKLLAKFYNGVLRLHSINPKGYWEFTIESYYYDEGTLYISKGLRKWYITLNLSKNG